MLADLDSADEITKHVGHLLRLAEVGERLPTPVEDIVAAAGLTKTSEIAITESMIRRAPEDMRRLLRNAARKIQGVLHRSEQVIQIAPTSSAERERFVTCHEVVHAILPWQSDLAVLGDDKRTLSPQVTTLFEREANQGAAEILFQQDLLARIALDYPMAMSTPVVLAQCFGASIHATFRRWVESIDGVACGLVLDTKLANGHRRRYEQVLTLRWRQQFGSVGFPKEMDAKAFPFAKGTRLEGTLPIIDVNGTPVELRYEALQTPYRRFALLWLPRRESLVARLRRTPTIVSHTNELPRHMGPRSDVR